jgi:hypothetical protein
MPKLREIRKETRKRSKTFVEKNKETYLLLKCKKTTITRGARESHVAES